MVCVCVHVYACCLQVTRVFPVLEAPASAAATYPSAYGAPRPPVAVEFDPIDLARVRRGDPVGAERGSRGGRHESVDGFIGQSSRCLRRNGQRRVGGSDCAEYPKGPNFWSEHV